MTTTMATTYRNLSSIIGRTNDRLNALYLQASSGQRLSQASDAPTDILPTLHAESQITMSDQYLKTMDTAQQRLDSTDLYLDELENLLTRCQEIAVTGGDGAYSDADRQTLADEVVQLQEQLLSIANAKVDGNYLFAGFDYLEEPFGGDPVVYTGGADHFLLEIGPGETVQTNLTGEEVFMAPVNLFDVLDDLRTALTNNDATALTAAYEDLDEAAEQGRRLRGQTGNINARVESSRSLMEDTKSRMRENLSNYRDADLASVATDISQAELALEAAMSVVAKVAEISILDYLD